MSKPWSYLRRRYGEEVGSPSDSDCKKAGYELFNENLPGMTTADYIEHGSAHLRYGYDNGPMYVLEIDRTGHATLEVWEDQDYEVEACAPRKIKVVSEGQATELWAWLASGQTEKVEAVFNANS
ncbi:hypothetical protein [Noviherbaspirillum sp. Root189]|uniref:hypothetical protein n=1 Tax=Noviherbaspirillum sp. Root189 TaxID=1736487 RepID=UPI00070B3DAB|nr:hypothetical protein [Noviherbaspirillum sp. Root189]KRB93808.1 hypothetical protein ASE07_12130 [Noviherbaspirillum sp. Root189]